MCGRTAGIFIQSIFRSPLAESDGRIAKEEVEKCRKEDKTGGDLKLGQVFFNGERGGKIPPRI